MYPKQTGLYEDSYWLCIGLVLALYWVFIGLGLVGWFVQIRWRPPYAAIHEDEV